MTKIFSSLSVPSYDKPRALGKMATEDLNRFIAKVRVYKLDGTVFAPGTVGTEGQASASSNH